MPNLIIMQSKKYFLLSILLPIFGVSCSKIDSKLTELSNINCSPFVCDTVLTRMDASDCYYVKVDSLLFVTWNDNTSTIHVKQCGGFLSPEMGDTTNIPYGHIDSLMTFFKEINVYSMAIDGQGNAHFVFPWNIFYGYEVFVFKNGRKDSIGFKRYNDTVIYRKRKL